MRTCYKQLNKSKQNGGKVAGEWKNIHSGTVQGVLY